MQAKSISLMQIVVLCIILGILIIRVYAIQKEESEKKKEMILKMNSSEGNHNFLDRLKERGERKIYP